MQNRKMVLFHTSAQIFFIKALKHRHKICMFRIVCLHRQHGLTVDDVTEQWYYASFTDKILPSFVKIIFLVCKRWHFDDSINKMLLEYYVSEWLVTATSKNY